MLLEHIAFLAQVSVSAARLLHSDLLTRIKGLEKTPYLYPVFHSNVLENEYRKLIYKRYLILYTVDEAAKAVRVEFVWDSRMNNSL